MIDKKTAAALAFVAMSSAALTLPLSAAAQTVITNPQPSGVLSLSAQASAQVPQDVVNITLFYEQEAADPSSLTTTLNQRAEAALREAKGVDNVTAKSGSFTVYPSTDRDGKISAWRGRTEVVLESHDFAAASKLAGKMSNAMQVGSVAFSLSPEAQRAAEQKLSTQAIESFRKEAQAASQAFGYANFTIREVNVGHSGAGPRPVMMMQARSLGADAKVGAPMALEAGTTTVTVDVSGSVQMGR
ncbi:SIMPL domain-containing protein [Caballeronia sp. LP006]|jgi:predicted secreted protein|uniref:SIMPL domain-containing protein n=1 Tax=unclassified Caballeronia TaxID=2646786 RepID=UPI001FD3BBEB|nr:MULTISPECIES: SIMPL domain-containing protein [unclassified Caballeronia]MDR5802842.1 SIMPL domain-containing protein [Caballeronia sp. LZ001]MDR5830509.1 SIMPL domain-containing protein [Caballeronia sp. LP006]